LPLRAFRMASSTAARTIFQTGSRARSEVFIPDEEDRIRINASDVYHLDLHIVRGDRRPSRARGALDDARALRPRGPRMTQTPLLDLDVTKRRPPRTTMASKPVTKQKPGTPGGIRDSAKLVTASRCVARNPRPSGSKPGEGGEEISDLGVSDLTKPHRAAWSITGRGETARSGDERPGAHRVNHPGSGGRPPRRALPGGECL
jgi:hypothetical protein